VKHRSLFIYGYHGRNNLGDDLFLEIITSKLHRIYDISKFYVSSPKDSKGIHSGQQVSFEVVNVLKKQYMLSRLSWLNIFFSALRTDGIVFCAGSIFSVQPFFLIRFVLSTLRLLKGQDFALIAVGISSGPYRSQRDRKRAHACFRMMDHIQVRDIASETDLAAVIPAGKLTRSFDIALGSPRIWSGDADRLLRPSQDHLTVGVCLHRRATELEGGQLAEFFSQIVETLGTAGVSVILLVACTDTEDGDLAIAQQLALDLAQVGPKPRIATYAPDGIESFLATMRSCDCIVTSRMHVAVAAIASAIPVLQINYAEKVAQFFVSHEIPVDNLGNADTIFTEKLSQLIKNCRKRDIIERSSTSKIHLMEKADTVEAATNITLLQLYQ
jgi:polysaccharide pyruvyl transferase WcaK-like protein